MPRARRQPRRGDPSKYEELSLSEILSAEALHDPWDKLEYESAEAYSAFNLYLQMFPNRSLRKVRHLRMQAQAAEGVIVPEPKNAEHIAEWSKQYYWVERAAAWDRHQSELMAAEARTALTDMRTRHAAIANAALSKVAERLNTLDSANVNVRDMLTMFDLGVKVERLSRGETTENVGLAEGADPLAVISDDLRERLRSVIHRRDADPLEPSNDDAGSD
jgi:hypothetical protein